MTSKSEVSSGLALFGGAPVRSATVSWPKWPRASDRAEAALSEVLKSDRWAISSRGRTELFERLFAEKFANYTGAKYCVPVDHGSSALVVALEALGLEYGTPVLVPALTWVASASAVFRAGLVPVLADVGKDYGCIGPEALDCGVAFGAMVAVHWASAMADIPAILQRMGLRQLPVVEDCAQAHGAVWGEKPAGTLGIAGCFSMQQAKVLSAGEGGAVITDDDRLADLIQQLRADSRRYRQGDTPFGKLELEETGHIFGANHCLSEFQSALLCEQLDLLDAQHKQRDRNWAILRGLIRGLPGIELLGMPKEQSRRCIYEMGVVVDPLPLGVDIELVADMLQAELNTPVSPPWTPMHRSELLCPHTKPSIRYLANHFSLLNDDRRFPNTDYLCEHLVLMHHSVLLGSDADMRDIANALEKVAKWLAEYSE